MSVAESDFKAERSAPDIGAWLPLVAALGLMFALYYGAMMWWYFEWTQPGSFYAHGIFIPFFVGIMIWRDRERLRSLPLGRAWWGLALVAVAAALVLISARAEVTVTLSISFIIFLIGASLVAAGTRVTRALLFPMLFLLTMIPLVPDQLINLIAFPIQLASSKMAATIFNLTGFDSVRIGTQIAMPDYRLNVELPCSGFKTLVGLAAFSAAFAYVVDAARWKQWALFLMTMPLALLVNGLRITLIGYVGELFGDRAAETFHDASGFIVLILGFMFLFSVARMLGCDSFLGIPLNDKPHPKAAPGEPVTEGDDEAAKPPTQAGQPARPASRAAMARVARHLSVGLYPVIAILVVACIARPAITAPHAAIPAVMSQDLPSALAAGAWRQQGGDIPIDPDVKATLKPISYINRVYSATPPNAGKIELLLTAGNGRRVFHDPHTCFLGSGYYMQDLRTESIDTPRGPLKVQVAKAVNTLDHSESLLMFCYVVDGRQLQTTQAVNTAIFWQMLLGDSGRPSYFLRFRNLESGMDEPRAQELRSFVRALWTQIAPAAAGEDNLARTASR